MNVSGISSPIYKCLWCFGLAGSGAPCNTALQNAMLVLFWVSWLQSISQFTCLQVTVLYIYIYICVTICIHTVRYLNIRIKVTKNVAKAIGPKLPEVPASGSSAFVSRCSGTVRTPSPLMAWGPGAQWPGGARGWDDGGSHDAGMVGGTFLMVVLG